MDVGATALVCVDNTELVDNCPKMLDGPAPAAIWLVLGMGDTISTESGHEYEHTRFFLAASY